MAASEQNNRRAEKAEIARHITTEETVAFMTALVAFLKEAEAAGHHGAGDPQPRPSDLPPTPAHAADPAPVETTPGNRQDAPGDQHADASAPPAGETATALHMDTATDNISHADGNPVVAATDSPVSTQQPPVDSHAAAAVASDHAAETSSGSAHTDVATSASIDPLSSLHDLGSTITNLVDTSLSAVSHTLDSLSTTVSQLTSTVTGTIGQLTDSVTGLVGGLLHSGGGDAHDASSPDLFSALVTDIVSTPLASSHDSATPHVDIGGLDTAGAVPMAVLPPMALHLGFLGQPTDGHDLHDGAFSALGVHHF
ncbi:hypothetical protein ACFQZO_12440 [Bradyrhizobium sp. GCM10027634]|uniref:hypothetical protein n=1 Tax=unclassified Bradyrhizobium TaxID=2631580 RepID=UPI00188BE6F7|nr:MULTISPECIES: hypothetical protein [unclassified Bradyrhizobium]MDN5001692.1 hypothetical protein [Bradyrhizobium sp. WYCCWR 12677]QOZ45982.1 hypothetical protein XH89_22765 [Bradyrhizobium sp. CCBAU 53340]